MANIKKYRCLNFGNCDKAGKKEVFEIPEGGELKCPECGSEMVQEVKSSGMKIIVLAVAAVLAVAGGAYAIFGGSKEEADKGETGGTEVVEKGTGGTTDVDSAKAAEAARQKAIADSIAKAKEDSIAKAREDSIAKAKAEAEKKGPETPPPPSNYLTNARCEYGLYTGPAVNGKPGGGVGTIKVQGNHTIDLRNARKETIDIKTGDIIIRAKYSDGRLVSGDVKFANGKVRRFDVGI